MKRATALILSVCALGLAATGCGGSSETARQDYCDSLADLSSTVMGYQGLDPATATNDEVRAAATEIDAAWKRVVEESHDLAYTNGSTLEVAYEDLDRAIRTMPGHYTVADSLEVVQDELSAFPDAFRDTFDGSGCASTA